MKKGKNNEQISTEDLATMVLKGLEELKTDLRSEMNNGFGEIRSELVKIRGDINKTKDDFVPYHKFDALAARVVNLEKGKAKK